MITGQGSAGTSSETRYLVGAARADITPPVGVPLGGYGARQGVSNRVADPLYCTAFVFDDGTSRICVVSCDLLYVTTDIRDAVRREVGGRTGMPDDAIMLVATHTHSGPANITVDTDPDYIRALATQISGAVEAAIAAAEPATVRVSTAELTSISMNRREPDGPIEDRVRTIVAESASSGRPLAVLMNYACHATVLEADSLAISADFPGAAARFVENSTGALTGYLQGCCGAINPVWLDHTTAEADRIGAVLGAVVVKQVLDGQGVGRPRRVVNLSRIADVDAPATVSAGSVVSGPIWHRTTTVRLRRSPTRSLQEVDRDIAAYDPAETSLPEQSARLARLQAERYLCKGGFRYWKAPRLPDGSVPDWDDVEVSAVGFGAALAVVGIPGEPFLEIGASLRRRSRVEHTVVLGYTNGTVGYLPTRAAFADHGYEVGMARYTPGAAERIVAAGSALIRAQAESTAGR